MQAQHDIAMLRLKVLEMAALVRIAVETAMHAEERRDGELARTVIDGDSAVDALDNEVDELAFRTLALVQPWAGDLRFIVAIIRACVHIERIGDEAVNIARAVEFLAEHPPLPPEFSTALRALRELAELSLSMLHNSVESLRNSDSHLARRVRQMEGRCMDYDTRVLKAFIEAMNCTSPGVERSVRYLYMARALTRIGKLSSNLAEGVFFIVEGRDIRHAQGI